MIVDEDSEILSQMENMRKKKTLKGALNKNVLDKDELDELFMK